VVVVVVAVAALAAMSSRAVRVLPSRKIVLRRPRPMRAVASTTTSRSDLF